MEFRGADELGVSAAIDSVGESLTPKSREIAGKERRSGFRILVTEVFVCIFHSWRVAIKAHS